MCHENVPEISTPEPCFDEFKSFVNEQNFLFWQFLSVKLKREGKYQERKIRFYHSCVLLRFITAIRCDISIEKRRRKQEDEEEGVNSNEIC